VVIGFAGFVGVDGGGLLVACVIVVCLGFLVRLLCCVFTVAVSCGLDKDVATSVEQTHRSSALSAVAGFNDDSSPISSLAGGKVLSNQPKRGTRAVMRILVHAESFAGIPQGRGSIGSHIYWSRCIVVMGGEDGQQICLASFYFGAVLLIDRWGRCSGKKSEHVRRARAKEFLRFWTTRQC